MAFATICVAKADNASAINRRAASEYDVPVRPGDAGKKPFWNEYSIKFMYAPAFDFKPVDGAAAYRFTISGDGGTWTFKAKEPTADLSPVWSRIPVGNVTLTVEGIDRKGNCMGKCGERSFLRDFPFTLPQRQAVCSYDECIRKALVYVHIMPAVKHWEREALPDMSYPLNGYVCKTVSNTMRLELMYAEFFPEEKESCLVRCRNMARFLMDTAQPVDAPLACFPPTYYKEGRDVVRRPENIGRTMCMEAAEVAYAMVDLYKASGERKYLDFAENIIETYRKIRRQDGSFPVKMVIATGESINEASSSPTNLILALERFETALGIDKYRDFRLSVEEWTRNNKMESYDWSSAFEDMPVEGIKPYENLCNGDAAALAMRLLRSGESGRKDIEQAEDLVRFCEDQFVHWNAFRDKHGIPAINVPCAVEQYNWRAATDASTASLMTCFALMYRRTGNKVWKAKAETMAAKITRMQNPITGMIPTGEWFSSKYFKDENIYMWLNCMRYTISCLMEVEDILPQI